MAQNSKNPEKMGQNLDQKGINSTGKDNQGNDSHPKNPKTGSESSKQLELKSQSHTQKAPNNKNTSDKNFSARSENLNNFDFDSNMKIYNSYIDRNSGKNNNSFDQKDDNKFDFDSNQEYYNYSINFDPPQSSSRGRGMFYSYNAPSYGRGRSSPFSGSSRRGISTYKNKNMFNNFVLTSSQGKYSSDSFDYNQKKSLKVNKNNLVNSEQEFLNNGNTLIKNNINFNSGFNQSNPSNNKNSSMRSYINKTKSRNRNRNRFFSSRFNSGRYNLSEYFENLNLFECNDQNNKNNSHFNPLRALFSDHISGITKKIFESWIKESYMLSEENLTNFKRIKCKPLRKERV